MTIFLISDVKFLNQVGGPNFPSPLELKNLALIPLLYLSGLNKMEGLLTKSNWLRFPPKPKEDKLNIMG